MESIKPDGGNIVISSLIVKNDRLNENANEKILQLKGTYFIHLGNINS